MIVAVFAGATITKFIITPTYSASSWVVAKPASSETSDANDIQLLNTYKNIVTSDVVLDDVEKKNLKFQVQRIFQNKLISQMTAILEH